MERIIVTGASSGIGRALAAGLAAPDREVWLIGRNESGLAETARAVEARGGVGVPVVLDLTDVEASRAFLESRFPDGDGMDQLYLAAAVSIFGEVNHLEIGDWQKIYQTNLLSTVQWLLHAYKGMVERRSGRIVVVSSLAAHAGYPTAVPYAAMKAALLGLHRSLVHEAKDHGVSLHLVSPGYVDTGIYRSAIFRRTSYERTMEQIKRMGFGMLTSEQAAAAILGCIHAGRDESAVPAYASALRFMAPRFPRLIDLIHRRMIKEFHSPS